MVTQIKEIIKNWNIRQDLSIREIDESDGVHYLGHIWFLGDSYVLKRHNIEDHDKLIRDFHILKALENLNFTSAPLYTNDGEIFFECHNDNVIYTLSKYVPGKTLTEKEIQSENMPAYGFKIGQAIAKLHLALAAIENRMSVVDAEMYKTVIEWAIPKTRDLNMEFNLEIQESIFDDYIKTFGKLYDKLPKQLIHRDSHPGNIIFNNGEVTGFIDFVVDERNVRLRDVCYCLTGLGGDFFGNPEKWFDIIRETLNGYNSVCPLTDEEKQSVFYIMCSIQFICVAYFAGNDKFKQAWEQNRKLAPFVVKHKDQIMNIGNEIK